MTMTKQEIQNIRRMEKPIKVGQLWLDCDTRNHSVRAILVMSVDYDHHTATFQAVSSSPGNPFGRMLTYRVEQFVARIGTVSGFSLLTKEGAKKLGFKV